MHVTPAPDKMLPARGQFLFTWQGQTVPSAAWEECSFFSRGKACSKDKWFLPLHGGGSSFCSHGRDSKSKGGTEVSSGKKKSPSPVTQLSLWR